MAAKVLHLSMKKQWYEMIERGFKKEEYREINEYWVKRLLADNNVFKHFDLVCFHYGYTKRTMTFTIESMSAGVPTHPEWGAPWYNVFIIKIGDLVGKTDSKGNSVQL